MPSHTLRAVPIPHTASPEVQQSFRLLSQNTNQQNAELTAVLDASGAESGTLAPTNAPHDTTKTIITNEDGSMDVILTWQYEQGVLPAENFVIFWVEGPAPLPALTVDDNAVMVGATARAFRFEGLNPNNNYRFGIAAGRRPSATSGMVVGTIVQPSSGGGSWADLTFGEPNYVGTVWGMEQHNFTVDAAGTAASDPLVALSKDDVVLWTPVGAGYHLLIYDLVTKSVVSQASYPIQSTPAQAAALAAALTGATGLKLLVLFTAGDPSANRQGGGLPDAIATVGGTRTLFSADSFQTGSAYVLVGRPLAVEGNGLEQYAGRTANAPDAHVRLTFQTQDTQVVQLAGTGWSPTVTPGAPTNAPTALAIAESTSETGERIHKLTWAYTQPALSGTNRLGDGFVLYVQKANTATPNEQQLKLDIAVRAANFSWSEAPGTKVSYAIAVYRKTTSGIEVGPLTTTALWQNRTADYVVQNAGIGPGEVQGDGGTGTNNIDPGSVDTPDLAGDGVTTDKRQNVSTQSASTAVVPPNSGSNPALFTNSTLSFSVSLGKVPTAIARSNLTLWPCYVTTENSAAIVVNSTNLSIVAGTALISIDYW